MRVECPRTIFHKLVTGRILSQIGVSGVSGFGLFFRICMKQTQFPSASELLIELALVVGQGLPERVQQITDQLRRHSITVIVGPRAIAPPRRRE
jgi:hypothetical protein